MFADSLPTALIVFREVLEAALVISIIMAATQGLPHRGKWVSLGIAGGVIGAGLVASVTHILAGMLNGALTPSKFARLNALNTVTPWRNSYLSLNL